jgi:hypothetical protein
MLGGVAQWGRVSAADPGAGSSGLIELPPMFVEGLGRAGPQWRHAAGPGFEVLSCCDDDTTEAFMVRTLGQQALLGELVPPPLQRKNLAPTIVILLSEDFAGSMSAEMVAEMRRIGSRQGAPGASGARIVGLPQLRLSESDSDMSYFILADHGGYDLLRLSPEFVSHLMITRVPALPDWFVAGVARLYPSTRFAEARISVGPLDWGSEVQTERLRRDARASRSLLPIAELFDPAPGLPADPAADEAYRRLWFQEAALLLRWALDDAAPERRAALVRWADLELPERQTEAAFRRCFGLGWADLRDRLSDYLPVAVSRPLLWRPAARPAVAAIDLRPAAPQEVRRIQGEWERREVKFIRDRYPDFLPHYIERARATLSRAYAAGDRDPRLLASIGLLDAETGDDAGAREFLAAAVQGGVERPRAAAELARARLAPFEGRGAAGGGDRPDRPALLPDRIDFILAPLRVARAQAPPQLATYGVLAEVMRLSAGAPSAESRAALREGARLFPGTPGLALAAATWEFRAGDRAAARRILEFGLAAVPPGADRNRLVALSRRMPGSPAAARGAAAAVDPWGESWLDPAARRGPDPRDRRDLGLAPDGRYFAYLAPFGGRVERLIVVDLERPAAPASFRLPAASSRVRDSRGEPSLSWIGADRIAIGVSDRSGIEVVATGSDTRLVPPDDPGFVPLPPPARLGARAGNEVVRDRRTQQPVGRRRPSAPARTDWTDLRLAAVQAALEVKLPDRRVSVLDWDGARDRFLAVAQTPDGKGRCFVFSPAENLLLEIPLEGPTG